MFLDCDTNTDRWNSNSYISLSFKFCLEIIGSDLLGNLFSFIITNILFFSLALSTSPYRPLLLIGPLDAIQGPHRADVCTFLLVYQHWCIHVNECTDKITYKLVFTSSAVLSLSCSSWMVCEMGGKWLYSYIAQDILLVLLGRFERWEFGGCKTTLPSISCLSYLIGL